MIDVTRGVELVPLIRMEVFGYVPRKRWPLFQRRVSPFNPLGLRFDVMKHGVNAFVRTGVGVLGLLVIFMTPEKKERTPGCKQREISLHGEEGMREGGVNLVS